MRRPTPVAVVDVNVFDLFANVPGCVTFLSGALIPERNATHSARRAAPALISAGWRVLVVQIETKIN